MKWRFIINHYSDLCLYVVSSKWALSLIIVLFAFVLLFFLLFLQSWYRYRCRDVDGDNDDDNNNSCVDDWLFKPTPLIAFLKIKDNDEIYTKMTNQHENKAKRRGYQRRTYIVRYYSTIYVMYAYLDLPAIVKKFRKNTFDFPRLKFVEYPWVTN